MRQTSVAAWNSINQSGVLGSMQVRVYNILYLYGPLTGRQLNKIMASAGDKSPSFHKRLAELKRWGVIKETGCIHIDEFTHQKNILWDVTDRMPVEPIKKKPMRTIINRATEALKKMRESHDASDSDIDYVINILSGTD